MLPLECHSADSITRVRLLQKLLESSPFISILIFITFSLTNTYYPEYKGADFYTFECSVSKQTSPFLNQGAVPIVTSFTNVW
jgi:hypothetical protein